MQRLRYDVLKQAEASLSSFIGTVDYSGSFSHSAALQGGATEVIVMAEPEPELEAAKDVGDTMFAGPGMVSAIAHANEMTMNYGVKILSINIIQAQPNDDALMMQLAQGAVAAAQARQAETTAHGKARALEVEAQGIARSQIIKAKGSAEAEKIAAEGALKAAQLLEQSPIAKELAKIDRTG